MSEWSDERAQLHGKMLSEVSHDLKTPLASIIGSLQIHRQLGGTLPQHKQDELLANALQEAYRLEDFINNILDMMRLEEGLTVPKPAPVNPAEFIQQAVAAVKSRHSHPQIQIKITGDVPDIAVDRQLGVRALALLLDNALKYAPDGKIEVEVNRSADALQIAVRDTGPGIPEHEREMVFEKYVRGTSSGNEPASFGLGLGLPIARLIARLHQGDITASARAGGGMEFVFTLPA